MAGAIDPNLLCRKLTKAKTPCVLASRLLMAMPCVEPMTLADEDVDESIQLGYETVVNELLRLPFAQQSRAFIPKVLPPHVETDEIKRNRELTEAMRQELIGIKDHLGAVHNFHLPPVPPFPPAEPAPPLPPEVTRPRAALVEVSKEARQKLSAFVKEIAAQQREFDPTSGTSGRCLNYCLSTDVREFAGSVGSRGSS